MSFWVVPPTFSDVSGTRDAYGLYRQSCLTSTIIFVLTVIRWCFYCVFLCHIVLSVPSSLVVACWERAGLLALLCVMFYCDFVTFQYGVLSQVWYLIVPISDICFLPYFIDGSKSFVGPP